MTVARNQVDKERCAYAFRAGGYVRLGKPPMPGTVMRPASACEPPMGGDGDSHVLVSPQGTEVVARWHAVKREWEPADMSGHRVAFESRYLAAYGWTYGGVA